MKKLHTVVMYVLLAIGAISVVVAIVLDNPIWFAIGFSSAILAGLYAIAIDWFMKPNTASNEQIEELSEYDYWDGDASWCE